MVWMGGRFGTKLDFIQRGIVSYEETFIFRHFNLKALGGTFGDSACPKVGGRTVG